MYKKTVWKRDLNLVFFFNLLFLFKINFYFLKIKNYYFNIFLIKNTLNSIA